MYLTLSVVFFLVTSLGASPGDGITLNVDGQGGANLQLADGGADAGSAQPAAAARPPATPEVKLDADRQRIVDSIVSRLPEQGRAEARRDLERELARMTPEQLAPVQRLVDDPCSEQNLRVDLGPFGDQYGPRLRDACRKIMSDSKTFGRALYENIPKMMFIFLPLIAAVMFVLYLGSGRYYVEHLLFFVHYHAFFFLGGLLVYGLDSVGGWLEGTAAASALRVVEGIVTAVLVFYVPYYLYRAMRRVYGQGRIVTLVKYSLLGIGYVFFMALTAVGLLAYTALTL
jgi:hypothetical protein